MKSLLGLCFIFILTKLLFLLKYPGVLGGDETYGIFKFIDLIPSFISGDISLNELLDSSQTHLYNLMAISLQAPITYLWYKILPTNEFAAFLGTLTTSTFFLVILFLSVAKLFNGEIAFATCLLYTFSPIGLSVAAVSADHPGSIIKLIMLFTTLYFLFALKNKKKICKFSNVLLMLLPFIDPYHLIALLAYISLLLISTLNKRTNKLKLIKWRELKVVLWNNRLLLYLSPLLYPLIIVLQETLAIKKKNGYINHFDFKLYWHYLKKPFIGDHTSNIMGVQWIAEWSFGILVVLALLFLGKQFWRWRARKGEILCDPSNFLALYLLFFVAIEFLFQVKIEYWSIRPLAATSNYLQLLLLMVFIMAAKVASLRMIVIICAINLFVTLNILEFKNNNFINYNLGNTDYARNFLSVATKVQLLQSNYAGNLPFILGVESRENDIRQLHSKEDILKCGAGIYFFYKNKLAINTCYRFIEVARVDYCKEGFYLGQNINKK
ncbi:MAG: hypothetical protein HQK51_12800 [Oligoflexia bacterium]|nr:hypothetical protein [Oligoflexia bacterium]